MINIKGKFIKGPNVVTNGLVMYLDAANTKSYSGSGTTWTNLAKSASPALLVNTPTYNTANGGYFDFDGVNDLVSITSLPNYSTSIGTISMWFRGTSTGRIFMQYNNDLNRMSITYDSTNGYIEIFSGYSTSVLSFATANNSVPVNTWTNVCFLYNFTLDSFQIYLNGTFSTSTTNSIVPTPDSMGEITLATGKDFDNAPPYYFSYFTGRIAQTLIYNRILSASEIAQNFMAMKTRFGY